VEQKLLSQFEKDDIVEISSIDCGREFSRRLCDLGLFEGTKIKIIKNDNFGPIIIQILDSKIALGRGETNKIYAKIYNNSRTDG
jgi:Fe2+ transport system protein FeoA